MENPAHTNSNIPSNLNDIPNIFTGHLFLFSTVDITWPTRVMTQMLLLEILGKNWIVPCIPTYAYLEKHIYVSRALKENICRLKAKKTM